MMVSSFGALVTRFNLLATCYRLRYPVIAFKRLGVSQAATTMPSTYQQDDKEITARAGETFVIELEGNPTTGYLWELAEGDEHFRLVEKGYAEPGSGVGTATKERFVIKAVKTGSTTLTFNHKRPWETEVLDTKTFRLHNKP